MSSNWKLKRLGDLISISGGMTYKSQHVGTGQHLMLGMGCVSYSEQFLSSGVKRYNGNVTLNHKVAPGDLIIATRQQSDNMPILGAPSLIPSFLKDKSVFVATNLYKVTNNSDVSNEFIYWLMRGKEYQDHIKGQAKGTTVRMITKDAIEDYHFRCPPRNVRNKVVEILSVLHKKAQINLKISALLEQMAQSLFKSWFVDFEPVKAKIAVLEAGGSQEDATLAAMTVISGKEVDALVVFSREHPEQYAELKVTAELFPSAMQDGELGEIPVGWISSEIGKEIDIAGGATPSTKTPEFWDNGDINWTTPKDLSALKDKILLHTERKITKTGLGKISSGLLPVNTVLMSSRAPVGYLAMAKIPVAINQGFIAMKCNKDLSPEFVLQWCIANMPEIVSRASGTTFAEISKKNFNPIPLVKPPVNLVKPYTKQVSAIYSLIENNAKENNSLTQLRDTLLPKLLSGEIALPEAEQAVSEAENV